MSKNSCHSGSFASGVAAAAVVGDVERQGVEPGRVELDGQPLREVERVEDATRELSVGDEIEAKFVSLDRKNRTLSLSIRAKDDAELAEALRNIDVTVLTRLIFMELLGFDQERLDNEKLIGYASRAKNAVQADLQGEYDITFILNPTRIEQVQAIAEAGLIMPRKATYFFPKVITGQVMNLLTP